jgi:4-hydroxybenzoate polyprenyltransferase
MMIVAFMLAALTPSVATEKKPAESAWEFHVATYLWAMSMDGNATLKEL